MTDPRLILTLNIPIPDGFALVPMSLVQVAIDAGIPEFVAYVPAENGVQTFAAYVGGGGAGKGAIPSEADPGAS